MRGACLTAVACSYVRVIVASSKARARFAFDALKQRHLSFQKGDILTVFRKDKDWWDGMCNGRFGSFPGNYVQLLDEDEAARLEAGDDSDDEEAALPPPPPVANGAATAVGGGATAAASSGSTTTATSPSPAASAAAESEASTASTAAGAGAGGQKARLFHLKGKDQIMVTKTVLSARSLNDGDVFVLDSGDGVVYLWNGTYARQAERAKGAYFAQRLAEEESSQLLIMEKGSEKDSFWQALGGRATVLTAAEGGDDDEVSRREMARRKLLRVVDSADGDAQLVPVNVDTTILSRGLLDAQHTYILDINEEVFVWAGMESSGKHKFVAMQKAEETMQDRPPHVSIMWVLDGNERVFFREQFVGWDEEHDSTKLPENLTKELTYELSLSDASTASSAKLVTDPAKLAIVKFNSKPKDGVKCVTHTRPHRAINHIVVAFLLFRWSFAGSCSSKNCVAKQPRIWRASSLRPATSTRRLWATTYPRRTSSTRTCSKSLCSTSTCATWTLTRRCASFCRVFACQARPRRSSAFCLSAWVARSVLSPARTRRRSRIMEVFAAQFLAHNPGTGLEHDTCFVLAFALIMLNTDHHNPAIKNKMTKEEFIRNNLRIGDDLKPQFLDVRCLPPIRADPLFAHRYNSADVSQNCGQRN